jgi:hypothetical protein
MGNMKVTSREVTLLVALLSVAIIYILYTFLFSPLLMNVSMAREALNVAEGQKIQVQMNYENLPEIRKQQKTLALETEDKVEKFIPNLNEDILVTFFAGTPTKGGPAINSVSFDQLAAVGLDTLAGRSYVGITYPYGDWAAKVKNTDEETVTPPVASAEGQTNNVVLVQGVAVTFSNTSYEQTISQLKAVEALKRTIVVDSLTLARGETGSLNGGIHYKFYGVDKLTDKDQGLNKTILTDPNGKANPFN